jgi:hypothetical protein
MPARAGKRLDKARAPARPEPDAGRSSAVRRQLPWWPHDVAVPSVRCRDLRARRGRWLPIVGRSRVQALSCAVRIFRRGLGPRGQGHQWFRTAWPVLILSVAYSRDRETGPGTRPPATMLPGTGPVVGDSSPVANGSSCASAGASDGVHCPEASRYELAGAPGAGHVVVG